MSWAPTGLWQTGALVCVGRVSATGETVTSRAHPLQPRHRDTCTQHVPDNAPDLWQREEANNMHTLDSVDAASLRTDIPAFRAGDNVKVHVKVIEGTRARVQVFQGVVIRRHGGGIGETYTVRKISFGVGVERTFPLHTPVVEKIEVVTRGDVRRAKLYYLRDLRGKAAKIKEKRDVTRAR